MKLTGHNPRFALFAGLKTDRIVIVTMVISGMMCGLVGMFRVYGAAHIYTASISNDYYFEGLMVAMIAQYQALPTVIISLLFAVLKIGAQGMETAAVFKYAFDDGTSDESRAAIRKRKRAEKAARKGGRA